MSRHHQNSRLAVRRRSRALATALAAGASGVVGLAYAQAPETVQLRDYDLAPGPLATVLNRIALDAGLTLSVDPALVDGRQAHPVRGRFEPLGALREALRNTGLELAGTEAGTYTVQLAPQGSVATLPIVKVEADAARLVDPPPEQGGFKADYQTSATKTPLSIRETPQSISVVTRESMNARQVRDLGSALELSASVGADRTSGAFGGATLADFDSLTLRGQFLDPGRDVRVDGYSDAEGGQADIALFERIEVVKGPSSLLYGPGSLAGFVNRVRKKPQIQRAGSLVSTIGSYDTYRIEGDVTGALDTRGVFSGRTIAVYENSGSFVNGANLERIVLAPSLQVELGKQTQALVEFGYQDQQGNANTGIPLLLADDGELTIPRISRSLYTGLASANQVETRRFDAAARLDHQWSDQWLTSLVFRYSKNEIGGVFGNYAYGINGEGDVDLVSAIADTPGENWAGELRVDGGFEALGREHRVLAGAEFSQRNLDSDFGYAYFGPANVYQNNFAAFESPEPEVTPVFKSRNRNVGAYTQVILSVTDKMRLIGGLRYDKARTGNGMVELNPSKVTGRVATTYDLLPNITAFASYSTSFVPVIANGINGEPLEPETGIGYETGIKSEWFENRLAATVSLFRLERDDVPLSLPREECVATLMSCSRSGGLQRTEGLEIEVNGKLTEAVTVGLAASWLDSAFIDEQDRNFGETTPGTVKRQSNLYLNYGFRSGALKGLVAGATVVSLGPRFGTRVGQFAEGYERVDLNFTYAAIPDWNLSIQVRNVFDARYIERVNSPGARNYFGAPTSVLARAEYRFKF